jgi:DNA-binding MarR family transcriptional regulator
VDNGAVASELRIVLSQLTRRLRDAHRLSLAHGTVLNRLDRDGAQSTTDLATAARVRTQSMGQTLNELEAQELVCRRSDSADGRRSILELTAQGRRVLAEERQHREGWLAQAIDQEFSAEEQKVLSRAVRLLAKLAEH